MLQDCSCTISFLAKHIGLLQYSQKTISLGIKIGGENKTRFDGICDADYAIGNP
jgi:hypothetical protein